jgi:glyoxylase-like metal-dependent hydrolase (beta-lactamase superfamily II)
LDNHGWNVVDAGAGVLWREYRFSGQATATTLVFRGADGGLVVVSPGTGLTAREYDALKDFGDVRALVANNTFHHLGQAPWRERFPDAQSYAPPRAVEALAKKMKGIPFRPLTDLPLGPKVRWEDPPGFKTGEAILSVDTSRGALWFTGDLLTNIPTLPGPPVRWLFTWTNSAPGFRLFRPGVWAFVKDKRAVRDWMLGRLSKDPPSVVVPAHGPPVDVPDVAAQARAQIERL